MAAGQGKGHANGSGGVWRDSLGGWLSGKQIETRLSIRPCVSIADAILEEQENLRCCIVVVGRRGITRTEEFVFGSTSNKILYHAKHCAVLVVE